MRNEIFVNTQVIFRGYLKNWVSCVELFVPLIESILLVHSTYSEKKNIKFVR